MTLKIAFVHDGVPTGNGGSRRALQILEWLTERHSVELVTTQAREPIESEFAVPVRWVPVAWSRSRVRRSVAPGLRGGFNASEIDNLAQATSEAQWIWAAWWPLVNSRQLMAAWHDQRAHISWDEDALSLSWLSAARAYARTAPAKAAVRAVAAASLLKFEHFALSGASSVIARSPRDAAYLRRVQRAPVVPVRNSVRLGDFEAARGSSPSSCEKTILFLGSMYEPNAHGLRWFIDKVWPAVASAVPGAELVVVGRGIDGAFSSRPSINVVGEVEQVAPWLGRARGFVAPIFFGAGLPYKVIESCAAGRPTVVSPHCWRALGKPVGLQVARSRDEWVSLLRQILTEPVVADSAGADAFGIAQAFALEEMHKELGELEGRVAHGRSSD